MRREIKNYVHISNGCKRNVYKFPNELKGKEKRLTLAFIQCLKATSVDFFTYLHIHL